MRVVKQTDRYVILDDVLPPEQFELMLEYAARADYARNPRWIKPWDLGDEMPWQTGETVYTKVSCSALRASSSAFCASRRSAVASSIFRANFAISVPPQSRADLTPGRVAARPVSRPRT